MRIGPESIGSRRIATVVCALLLVLAGTTATAQTLPETSPAEPPAVDTAESPEDGRGAGHRMRARHGRGGGEGPPCARKGGAGREGQSAEGGCGGCGRHRDGEGAGMARGHGRAEMETIWSLIDGHRAIERQVEEIPGGVRTVTTSEDPELVALLRRHAVEMAELIEDGGRIRMWDPLFAELLGHSEDIRMEVTEVEAGVVVTETSERPEVAALIRAHAHKVSEFVRRGEEAYFEPTALPEAYSP